MTGTFDQPYHIFLYDHYTNMFTYTQEYYDAQEQFLITAQIHQETKKAYDDIMIKYNQINKSYQKIQRNCDKYKLKNKIKLTKYQNIIKLLTEKFEIINEQKERLELAYNIAKNNFENSINVYNYHIEQL